MKVTIEPAMLSDLADLSFTPEEGHTMAQFFSDSEEVSAGRIDGQLICLWGMIPASLLSDKAYIWSYAFPAVTKYPKTFLKVAKIIITQYLKAYPTLICHCTQKITFIKHIGGELVHDFGPYSTYIIRA